MLTKTTKQSVNTNDIVLDEEAIVITEMVKEDINKEYTTLH